MSVHESLSGQAQSVSRVCLIVPYFNAGEALIRSLASVQLLADDLIIVVDDGSDQLPAHDFCPERVRDTPVRLMRLESNCGIARALRLGIESIPEEYELIARLDCGDTCAPERFDMQRQLLDKNSALGLVGSWVKFVDTYQRSLYIERFPVSPEAARMRMRVNSAFCHPAVMFRKATYDATRGYSDLYPAAEDFALFFEILRLTNGQNIGQVLVTCLTSDGGISETRRRQQLLTRIKILILNFDWHPLTCYGVLRALLQVVTPRSLTTVVKRNLSRLRPKVGEQDS